MIMFYTATADSIRISSITRYKGPHKDCFLKQAVAIYISTHNACVRRCERVKLIYLIVKFTVVFI